MSVSARVTTARNRRSFSQIINEYTQQIVDSSDEAMRVHANALRNDIIEGWPVDTGASRAGWQGPTKIGEAHYQLRNLFPYAVTIEYGGYPSPGPKTAQSGGQFLPGGIVVNGGVYPTQVPIAPVRQAMSKRKLAMAQELAPQITRQSGFRGFGGGGTSTAFSGGS